jgi:3-oxoadipate enol-lactonase
MSTNHSIIRLGTKLHYWITGPEKGQLIALAHGATMDHHTFDAQVPSLVEAGYRVLTLDLRGHGESTPIGEGISIAVLADDLKVIIDQIGVEHVVLVGHSFGGFVVQEFTHRFPERVRALVVIGCTNLATKPSLVNRLLFRVFPGILARMSLDEFRKRTLANLSLTQEVKEYAAQAMKGISKDDFISITIAGIAALWLDSGFEADYLITKPFLLTHGAQDRANGNVYPKQAKIWAAHEPNCQYEIIPDAGHTAHMDNPAAFNTILLDFLKSNVHNE